MNKLLTLLSGPVASGKTSVGKALMEHHGFSKVSSSDYLRSLAKHQASDGERQSLQDLGDTLDIDTDYAWVVTQVALPQIASSTVERHLFDAVRKRRQVEHFRSTFNNVLHVHVEAPEPILLRRYVERACGMGLSSDAAKSEYQDVLFHQNEIESRSLRTIADLVFDSSKFGTEQIAIRIAGWGK